MASRDGSVISGGRATGRELGFKGIQALSGSNWTKHEQAQHLDQRVRSAARAGGVSTRISPATNTASITR